MSVFSAADPIVILSYARTPMGSMQGALSDASATELGATAVKAAVERAGVAGEDVDRIYMGCVLPAGLGQAPARQAALKAGLPKSVQATTVNKVCGSGMQTVIMGAEALAAGLALVLSAVGLYGVLSYGVTQRTQEIGVRLALGAEARTVRRMFVWQGARVALLGVFVGALAAMALTRYIQTLLFGVGSLDAMVFVGTSAAMLVVALVASDIPARRASQVDPLVALRDQ